MKIDRNFLDRCEVSHWAVPTPVKVILCTLSGLGYIVFLPFLASLSFILLGGYRLGKGLIALK